MEPMGIIKIFIEKNEICLKNQDLNFNNFKEDRDPEHLNNIYQYMNSLRRNMKK